MYCIAWVEVNAYARVYAIALINTKRAENLITPAIAMWLKLLLVVGAALLQSSCVTPQPDFGSAIYVNPSEGQDTEACLTNGGVNSTCASLEYAAGRLTDSTVIVLADAIHLINSRITITDVDDLTLTGDGFRSTIYCHNGADAGLRFERVSNIALSRLLLRNCGSLSQSTSRIDLTSMAMFRAALYILNTTNVTVDSLNVTDNRGVGVALYNVNGHVSLENTVFVRNVVPKEERLIYNGGGGLYIEHTYCTPGLVECDYRSNPYSNDSVYKVTGCTFVDNHATTPPQHSSSIFVYQEKTTSRHFGAGGGLLIVIKGNSHGNQFIITDSRFEHNSAGFGGAVLINVQDYVRKNAVTLSNVTVTNNHADFGGGGVATGILFYELDSVFANEINFNRTDFYNNSSPTGGGTYLFIGRTKSSELIQNSIHFSNCRWYFNTATLGAAVLLSPDAFNTLTDGYLPVPVFEDCIFENNRITSFQTADNFNVRHPAVGALFSSTFTINITSNVKFRGNTGTALSITAGSINILENAVLEFENNTGMLGGALALLEFASLRLFPHSRVTFSDNYAAEVGGAIYASAQDELDFYFSRSCFIHYMDVTVPAKDWKTSIEFINNTAGPRPLHSSQPIHGDSIFAVTILPCLLVSDTTGEMNVYNAFPHGDGDPFTFVDSCNGPFCGIATTPNSLEFDHRQFDSDGVLRLSPGESRRLSITPKDELNNTVSSVITASAFPPEDAVIDSASLYITDNRVQVNGMIGSKFFVTFHATGRKLISVSVNATFVECPSGFVYDTEERRCLCSARVANKQYLGIIRCNTRRFESYQTKGYWAGCDRQGTLLTADCPAGYCRKDENTTFNTNRLPKTCDRLDSVICGVRNRTGLLCGECIPNNTVFYHSERYYCHECNLGHFGWLFYTLTELLPVTLVFLTVVVCNFRLTTGLWNGAILYAQTLDFIHSNSLPTLDPPRGVSELTGIYRFIYAMFNLDFFKYEDLFSFCLWNRATVLDVLIFKYITSAYTLLLLLILILSFKIPCCQHKCQKAWARGQAAIRRSNRKDWVIHGISAFLVLSYAQCVKVSFQILSAASLYGEGLMPVKTVVTLSGTVEYFSPVHLRYALPAIFVLIVTTLPLILLIMYPNGLQLFTACFGENNVDKVQHCFNKVTCNCFARTTRITRLKPLFDSFQGGFKDKFRFFASLFFLYRFIVSLISALSPNPVSFYVSMEVVVIAMLAVHAWAQPYERRFYNLLDTFFYVNIAVINALSLFNYFWLNNPTNSDPGIVSVVAIIKVFLNYVPLVYIATMLFLVGASACSRKARRRLRHINKYIPLYKPTPEERDEETDDAQTIPFNEETLPYRIFDDSQDEF